MLSGLHSFPGATVIIKGVLAKGSRSAGAFTASAGSYVLISANNVFDIQPTMFHALASMLCEFERNSSFASRVLARVTMDTRSGNKGR